MILRDRACQELDSEFRSASPLGIAPSPQQTGSSLIQVKVDRVSESKIKILIAYEGSDPPDILQAYLQVSHEVEVVRLQAATLRDIIRIQPQLVVCDCGEDLTNVLNVCRMVSVDPKTSEIPIVILSASNDEIDEVVAFKLGATDYIAKPFMTKSVAQRLHSLLRRVTHSAESGRLVDLASFKLHRLFNVVEIKGQKLQLTSTECDILELLSSRPGHPFHRREILGYCRGLRSRSSERTIDVHVRNLRHKLKDFDLIQTQRGVGYFMSTATLQPAKNNSE